MTDVDPLGEELARTFETRAANIEVAAGTAHAAQSRAKRRQRNRRRLSTIGASVVAVIAVSAATWALVPGQDPQEPVPATGTRPDTSQPPAPDGAPDRCVPPLEADRGSLNGSPVWARLCAGNPSISHADAPSDALVTHLDVLTRLTVASPASSSGGTGDEIDTCLFGGRTYRLQVGYADGSVAQVSGSTDPRCAGELASGGGDSVKGPEGFGVYGTVMSAFGQQYADDFSATPAEAALTCPGRQGRRLTGANLDGPSASLDTGYHYGRRVPMTMPLTAVRGIVCTWRSGSDQPTVRDLSDSQAERVRIGLHAIQGGYVDCAGTPGPTYTAVVEDKTGTRRAVRIDYSQCGTVYTSTGEGGLNFAWLDR